MRDNDAIGDEKIDNATKESGQEPRAVKSDIVLKIRYFKTWDRIQSLGFGQGKKKPKIITIPDKSFPIFDRSINPKPSIFPIMQQFILF